MADASHAYLQQRIRALNDRPIRDEGKYVLYWMQMYRRLDFNHALNHAIALANSLKKPLVIYEGLRLDYPWANHRFHQFILEGMAENARVAEKRGWNYWPFVETPDSPGRGLLRKVSDDAAAVVTDDYPCFIVPDQSAALARKVDIAVHAVDGNGIVPMASLGPTVSAAAHLRPRIHKAFAEAWKHRSGKLDADSAPLRKKVDAPFATWKVGEISAFVTKLPLDDSVKPVSACPGGTAAGRKRLRGFLSHRLKGYAEHRSEPTSPENGHASGLSPYLHFGHVSIEEIVQAVLEIDGAWTTSELNPACRGKREGYFSPNADVNNFLDEAITWRDLGFHWHQTRRADTASLASALPTWANATLKAHASDTREFEYTLEEWEACASHDPLWNAAQKELIATGTIQNYLRMLWGKKVLEWTRTPEEAYRILVHLNNKYALDGRDPNSYTNILWCFGLFDRPWAPERKVFGKIRYMSSANTAKKFKVQGYLDYVTSLGA